MTLNEQNIPIVCLPFFLASLNMLFGRKGHRNAILGEAHQLSYMQWESWPLFVPHLRSHYGQEQTGLSVGSKKPKT